MEYKPLKILAERMFPSFVAEDHPRMIEFMEKVFEYMDKDNNHYANVSNLLAYTDVDQTLDVFEDAFRRQYLKNFPEALAADVDLLVKNIRSFYLNKGTEESFRFLFGALFDSTVNFKYPKFNILRASHNDWYTPVYLVLKDGDDNVPPLEQPPSTDEYDLSDLVNRFITGTTSGAVAFVEDETKLADLDPPLDYNGNGQIIALSIVEKEGDFVDGEQILVGDTLVENGDFSSGQNFWTSNIAGDENVTVANGQLTITQPTGNVVPRYVSQAVPVKESTQYWLRYSLLSASAEQARITVGYGPGTAEIFDSGNIGLSAPVKDTPLLTATAAGTRVLYLSLHNEMETEGDSATFDGISLVEEDTSATPILYIADLLGTSGIITGESTYKTNKGFLSQGDKSNDREQVLQDGFFYQDYAYQIKSSIPTDQFESIIRDLVHPAGFKLFAEVLPPDTLDSLTFKTGYYTSIVITAENPAYPDGSGGFYNTIERQALDGPDFDKLFSPGDLVQLQQEETNINNGYYRVLDTPNSTTLVFGLSSGLASEDLSGTLLPTKLSTGVTLMVESSFTYDFLTLLDIPSSTNRLMFPSNDYVFVASTKTITGAQGFTTYLVPGDSITVSGTESNDGTYTIDSLTNTSITVVEPLVNEQVTQWASIARSENYDNNNQGLRVVDSASFISREIEYINRLGFGNTWQDQEIAREANEITVGDWASLVIGDFDSKATSRFGFIPSTEIDIGTA